ncbi:uncharacterized protein LOC129769683 isoform X1 [Toxorhynchites rutilus septentrionalis]|uniref:uncharacterized protein LOC129769683 isoform X1 n=1 Tax=Toxorhynchites rutilus septentrionalis TaxID=329112 RepID=UPI0024792A4A|nr:uncharacterized protein LOC129769683 isoform X1 [Toxorhynchites rutilus septentrionalis]XP_055628066.1 uncharacterized protein LOC129769683 isoform X1 [Toxorhynchites rutilus septentrionalis]
MFRVHTSRYGSCASEIHKTMCYFFAGLNIFLTLHLMANLLHDDLEVLDDLEEYFDRLGNKCKSKLFSFWFVTHFLVPFVVFVGGPAVANFILAVMLIFGVYDRRPALIRVFQLFIIAQMVVIGIISVFVYTIVVQQEISNFFLLFVLTVFTALFGAEAWIAGDYYKLLLEEIRFESFEPTTA